MWELKSGCEDETTILFQPWSFSLSAITKTQGLVFFSILTPDCFMLISLCMLNPDCWYLVIGWHFPIPWALICRAPGVWSNIGHWPMVVARPLSNQRLDREVPSWEFLSRWSGHLPSESPSFLMILGVLFRICRHFEVLTDWRMDMKKRLLDIKARSSLSS